MFADSHGRNPAEISPEGKRMLWWWQMRTKLRERMMAVWTLF
jgi:hypothetical protein